MAVINPLQRKLMPSNPLSPGSLVYLSSALFKPLSKRLEVCEEVVMTLERALPNDEYKVRKVEKETLDQMQKFIGLITREIGPKHMVQLVVHRDLAN